MNRLWNQAVLTRLLMLFGAFTLSQMLTGCPPCEDCGTTTETPTQAVPTEPYEPPTTPPATQPTSPTPDSPTPNAPTPDSPTPTPATPTPCTAVFYLDSDGDGYGDDVESMTACTAPEGYVAEAGDCDDAHTQINPDADEVCDPEQTDEDCNDLSDDQDGGVDPSSQSSYYPDLDQDGYGSSTAPLMACTQPSRYAESNDDCNDAQYTIHPKATELCDGLDNDCDPKTVEDCWDVANWDEGSWQ